VHPGDCIIFHVEALDSAERAIAAIRKTGASVGVSLRPGTSLDRIASFLDDVSVVLVMSVEPGFGGQAFRPDALERIRDLSRMIGGRAVDIAVDGGIHAGNAAGVVAAGAEILVAGSSIFAVADRLGAMRALLEAAR
jgi:ribulose-phosphate 3-epimerase